MTSSVRLSAPSEGGGGGGGASSSSSANTADEGKRWRRRRRRIANNIGTLFKPWKWRKAKTKRKVVVESAAAAVVLGREEVDRSQSKENDACEWCRAAFEPTSVDIPHFFCKR